MTGMTDISRHGGNKSNRDELDITVKDDALIDPKLLGASDSMTQIDLVDDSDDDDGYDLADSGPGMASKVVQNGFRVLFFPLICVFKGVKSLKYIPQWCCRIGQGCLQTLRQGPGAIKNVGPFFKSVFSSTGWLGRIVILVGTYTGIAWVCRKIANMSASLSAKRQASRLARQEADEEAAIEREILAEEAALAQTSHGSTSSRQQSFSQQQASNETSLKVQSGNGPHKATVQFASTQKQSGNEANAGSINQDFASDEKAKKDAEQDSPKSSRFGKLNRFAGAFRRSSSADEAGTVPSDDTLSISSASKDALVDDYDPFAAASGRWSAKKRSVFAAACLVLIFGGVGIAKLAMQKDADVAANTQSETDTDTQKEKANNDSGNAKAPSSVTTTESQKTDGRKFNGYAFNQSAPGSNAISSRSRTSRQFPQAGNDDRSSTTATTLPSAPNVGEETQSSNVGFGGFQSFQASTASQFPQSNGDSTDGSAVGFSNVGFGNHDAQAAQSGVFRVDVEDDESAIAAENMFAQKQNTQTDNAADLTWQRQITVAANERDDAVNVNMSATNAEPLVSVGSLSASVPNDYGENASGTNLFSQNNGAFVPASAGDSYSSAAATSNQSRGFALHDQGGDGLPSSDHATSSDNLPVVAATVVPSEEYTAPGNFSLTGTNPSDMTVAEAPRVETGTFDMTASSTSFAATQAMSPQAVPADAETLSSENPQTEQRTNLAATPRMRSNERTTGFSLAENEPAVARENAPPLAEVFGRSQPSETPSMVDMQPSSLPAAASNENALVFNDPRSATSERGFVLTPEASMASLTTNPTAIQTMAHTAGQASTQLREDHSAASMAFTSPTIPSGTQNVVTAQPVATPYDMTQADVAPISLAQAHAQRAFSPQNGLTQPDTVSAQAQNELVAPSHHMAAMPMILPVSRQSNSAASNEFPSLTAQADTPVAPYAAQSQPAQPLVPMQTASLRNNDQVPAADTRSAGVLQNSTPLNTASNGNGGTYVYIVQEGDDIFSIAKQELGRVRRYREIYDLNRDRLPTGQNTLIAGTELLLPAH